jgi:formyltetrahydrofolate hydrolase
VSTASGPSCGDRRLVLTVTCPDSTGIVATVTGFIAEHGGSVVEAAQHGDLQAGRVGARAARTRSFDITRRPEVPGRHTTNPR